LNNAAAANVPGVTFYVGYGTSSSAMLANGTNRSVVTLPGSAQCQPAPPQTGWWWNPLEDGRGFSIEVRGNNIFFASFLYDVSGRGFFMEWQNGWLDIAGYMYDDNGNSVWYLTVDQLKGATNQSFGNNWWSYANGQTLTGAWKPNTRINANVAPLSITFSGPD